MQSEMKFFVAYLGPLPTLSFFVCPTELLQVETFKAFFCNLERGRCQYVATVSNPK